MTAVEKNNLMNFLDLAADYLKDGHAHNRAAYEFSDDDTDPGAGEKETGLPLAYIIEEPDEFSPAADFNDSLERVGADISACKACELGAARIHAVPGEGASRPLVMVIGEGPGADEDTAGRPFVGKAGQLLDKMLASVRLFRNKNCYIANVVKCRPPANRDPAPEEIAACFPFLERQIALLRPSVIFCAGRVAAQNLLKTNMGINNLRGTFSEYRLKVPDGEGTSGETVIPVLCTFHPSAILRDESLKRPAWEDLKLLKSKLVSVSKEYASEET